MDVYENPEIWTASRARERGCARARANVAFSCWRGLASSVKARQRLYRRKVQGRASQLQRDVRRAFQTVRLGLYVRSLALVVTTGMIAVGGSPDSSLPLALAPQLKERRVSARKYS